MGLVKARVPTGPHRMDTADNSLPTLLADLVHADAGVRRRAARGLAAHPEAAMFLCDRLEVEASPSVRAMLLTSLIRLQSPEIAGRLAGHLRSDDVPLRNAVVEALQEMPDAVAPHLQALLVDPDSDVRIFAVNILGALRLAVAPHWLVGVIRTETHINVCAAAVDALAEIGGPDATEALEALRARFPGEAFLGFAIDIALRRIEGGAA